MRNAISRSGIPGPFTRNHAALNTTPSPPKWRSISHQHTRSHLPWIPNALQWRAKHHHAATPRAMTRPSINRSFHESPMREWRRTFITDGLPSFLVPPAVFTGLLLALWGYKCIMTVLFQDKILYMSYMPPFARSEKMQDYTPSCKPVEWQAKHIRSMDGTKIAISTGKIPQTDIDMIGKRRRVVICYFQGNGGSTPPRLPLLSNTLKSIMAQQKDGDIEYVIAALSYRGYWTSSGRASQKGIELDAQALLRWVNDTYAAPGCELQLVLWGHSVGAGVASTAAAAYIQHKTPVQPPIIGLVLETPFTGIKSMLIALYPQKWLPYRYLWPFLWNHWDSEAALHRIAESDQQPKILLLPATRDEVVPPEEVDKLEKVCRELDLQIERKNIMGALHFEATIRREGQESVAHFVLDATSRSPSRE